jgi:hypothetical protein
MRSRARRLGLVVATTALVVAGCTRAPHSTATGPEPGSDPRAVAIADEVMTALGGKSAWDALPGLRWSFGSMLGDSVRSTRRHAWNKRTGEHRVEGVNRAGQRYTFIHTVGDTTTGMAWMNGQKIEGDSLLKLLHRAEALWVNDTYWMLMPYKLRDPGVLLGYVDDTTMNGATYDRLALSFHGVGLTPGDRYRVFVNRMSHRVEYWDMVLEGDAPPPEGYTWEGWEVHDGLWFPTAHRRDSVNVFTNRIETVSAFAPAEFREP